MEASDITAVRTPSLSISSISLAGVQSTIGLKAGMLRLPSHSSCMCEIGRRIEVAVRVDQRLGGLRAHRGRGQHRGGGGGADTGQELAAGRDVLERNPGQLWNSIGLLPGFSLSGSPGLPR